MYFPCHWMGTSHKGIPTITERMSVCPRGEPLMSLPTSGTRGEISQLSEVEPLVKWATDTAPKAWWRRHLHNGKQEKSWTWGIEINNANTHSPSWTRSWNPQTPWSRAGSSPPWAGSEPTAGCGTATLTLSHWRDYYQWWLAIVYWKQIAALGRKWWNNPSESSAAQKFSYLCHLDSSIRVFVKVGHELLHLLLKSSMCRILQQQPNIKKTKINTTYKTAN